MTPEELKKLSVSMHNIGEAAIRMGEAQLEYAQQLYDIATQMENEQASVVDITELLKSGREK